MQKWVLSGMAALAMATSAEAADLADVDRYIFVPNRNSADVAVIDTRENRVVARLAVGNVPHQVAVSDTLGKLVASNTADNTISVIDLAGDGEATTIALGLEPEHMELAPNGELLAVGNIGAGSVSLVSLGEEREIARVEGLYEPHNLTFSPDGSRLYVGNLGADFVSVIDVASARVVEEIPVGEGQMVAHAGDGDPEYQGVINVTRTPDGRLGFAAFGEGNRLAVLDLRNGRKKRSLELGELPWRAYSTADGRYMIVPNNGDETVSIISTSSLEEVARLRGANGMTGVNTGWFETTAFVISNAEDKLVVLDLETMQNAGEIALPGTPETGVTTPDGTRLYVSLSSTNQVAVIDTRERRLVDLIDNVGEEPWGAFMVGSLNYCH